MGLETNQGVKQQDGEEMSELFTQPASPIKSHRKKSPMFHSAVTNLDRWLVRKMVDIVGNPPVRISLWDGVE
ncbi:MAG: hypothetical protein DRQ44_10215, partial [Gammaproteobacteria bacterium]